MHEAYLIAWIDSHHGRLSHVQVAGESPDTITRAKSHLIPASLHRAVSQSFEAAADACARHYLNFLPELARNFPLPKFPTGTSVVVGRIPVRPGASRR